MKSDRSAQGAANPFQAALLSVAIVLVVVGVLTFGFAAAKATPSALSPTAAADALPSLIWGGVVIGVGAISFLFWLLVSALRWKDRSATRLASALVDPSRSTESV